MNFLLNKENVLTNSSFNFDYYDEIFYIYIAQYDIRYIYHIGNITYLNCHGKLIH